MRYRRAFFRRSKKPPPTPPARATCCSLRAGYMRRVGAGIYSFLPLGLRVLRKIERIVREEMDRAGAQEVLLPALLPAEYFKETGRWDLFGDTLLPPQGSQGRRLPPRADPRGDHHRPRAPRDARATAICRRTSTRSRPSSATSRGRAAASLRGREFSMKDAYSFDVDESGALASYETMRAAYTRIFDRMGFDYRMVKRRLAAPWAARAAPSSRCSCRAART